MRWPCHERRTTGTSRPRRRHRGRRRFERSPLSNVRDHLRRHRRPAIGVYGELSRLDSLSPTGLLDELLREGRALGVGDHPTDDVANQRRGSCARSAQAPCKREFPLRFGVSSTCRSRGKRVAMQKPVMLASPDVRFTSRSAGLMSLWMIPLACSSARAPAMAVAAHSFSTSVSGLFISTSSGVPPGSSSTSVAAPSSFVRARGRGAHGEVKNSRREYSFSSRPSTPAFERSGPLAETSSRRLPVGVRQRTTERSSAVTARAASA